MKGIPVLLISCFVLMLLTVPALVSALPIVCVPTGGDTNEETALQGSLTTMGYTLRLTNDPTTSDCTVYVSHPGQGPGGSGPGILAWVQAGNGAVQISDWGPDLMTNGWTDVPSGSPQLIEIVDTAHPITSGLPASWSSRGFWAYGYCQGCYLGYATSAGDPNIVRAGGYDKALSARAEGAGKLVYIGWNVFGSYATSEDLTILQQAINWAGNAVVSGPDLSGEWRKFFCSTSGCRGKLKIHNTEDTDAGPFTVAFYSSSDGTTLERLLVTSAVSGLRAGKTMSIPAKFHNYAIGNGFPFIIAVIDSGAQITETNEANNRATIRY